MSKAILMAAGRGTRLSRSIGSDCKCTLDIGGTTLIRHTVEMLLKFGIDVHIVTGYNKKLIYESLHSLPVTFHENVFYSITNSLASLWFTRDIINGNDAIILGNADVFWEEDMLTVLLEDKRDAVMLCDSSRVEQGDYLFYVENEKVLGYGKFGDCNPANCEYVGLAKISGEMIPIFKNMLIRMVEMQRHNGWWENVLYSMIPQRPIWAKDISGQFWEEIDFIEDYERILEYRRQRHAK